MKKFIKILAVLLILAGISCGVVAFLRYREEQNAGEEYEVLREQVVDPVTPEEEPEEPEMTEPSVIEEEGVECPIDFSALQEENPDAEIYFLLGADKQDLLSHLSSHRGFQDMFNLFVNSHDQSQACLSSAMARKRRMKSKVVLYARGNARNNMKRVDKALRKAK